MDDELRKMCSSYMDYQTTMAAKYFNFKQLDFREFNMKLPAFWDQIIKYSKQFLKQIYKLQAI